MRSYKGQSENLPSKAEQDGRKKAKRGINPGIVILLAAGLSGFLAITFVLSKILFSYQQSLIPTDMLLSGCTNLGAILTVIPSFMISIPFSILIGRAVVWLIPPARKAFHPQANASKRTMRKIVKQFSTMTLTIIIICAPISVVGARNYFYLTREDITYGPLLSLKELKYRWCDVREIRTGCSVTHGRGGPSLAIEYALVFNDDTEINLLEFNPFSTDLKRRISQFLSVYPSINKKFDSCKIARKRSISDDGFKLFLDRHSDPEGIKLLQILQNG